MKQPGLVRVRAGRAWVKCESENEAGLRARAGVKRGGGGMKLVGEMKLSWMTLGGVGGE